MKLATLFVTAASAMNIEQIKTQAMNSVSEANGGSIIKCISGLCQDLDICIETISTDPACQYDEDGKDLVDPDSCQQISGTCITLIFAKVFYCILLPYILQILK